MTTIAFDGSTIAYDGRMTQGNMIVRDDYLPECVVFELERGLFYVDRPLWYWCAIDGIQNKVKDLLYRNWLHET